MPKRKRIGNITCWLLGHDWAATSWKEGDSLARQECGRCKVQQFIPLVDYLSEPHIARQEAIKKHGLSSYKQ